MSDARAAAPLFSLPEQEGFVKCLAPAGWCVWACGAGGARALAARGAWLEAAKRVGAAPRVGAGEGPLTC